MKTNNKLVEATPEAFADRLGELRAEIKTLQDQAKGFENFLKDRGQGEYCGEKYRVIVVHSSVTKINWKAVAEKCEPTHQLVSAHTSVANRTAVKVTAHVKSAG